MSQVPSRQMHCMRGRSSSLQGPENAAVNRFSTSQEEIKSSHE